MSRFLRYYKSGFRQDLNRFIENIPIAEREHLESRFAFQYHHLSPDYLRHLYGTLVFPYFIMSLYLIILVDQVAYTHFHRYYTRFRELTQYPKFFGDCLGACSYHMNPNSIWSASGLHIEHDEYVGPLKQCIPDMKEDVISFFRDHMPEINGVEFWEKCVAEFPSEVRDT